MRKRYRVLVLAAFAAALAVPLGFALSPSSQWPTAPMGHDTRDTAIVTSVAVPPPVVGRVTNSTSLWGNRTNPIDQSLLEAAKLMLVGTLLIGVAAVVRRAR
jgi:hypothetical protein